MIRLAGFAGGTVLAFVFSEKFAAHLAHTGANRSLHESFYKMLGGSADGEAGSLAGEAGSESSSLLAPYSGSDGSYLGFISKSIRSLFTGAADKAADAAASRLTEIALSVIAFALIIIAVSLAISLLRYLLKKGRKKSIVLGFTDRTLGFVLGAVRGLLLAWVAVALLIPVTTLMSPQSVPGMISALQETTVSAVLYDVNPLLLLVKYIIK